MIRSLFRSILASGQPDLPLSNRSSASKLRYFASNKMKRIKQPLRDPPMEITEMPFLHHGHRPRYRDYEKFKSPRKRASKMLSEITQDAIQKSKASRPDVWTDFEVGDALEVKLSEEGVGSIRYEKIRGVVIGIFRRGLDSTVLLRDVVMGKPMERLVPLHSPLLLSIKVLEKNFIYKGRRKVKRAKLYFLRDRNPNLTKISKR